MSNLILCEAHIFHEASGLLGRQVRKTFDIDSWKAVGTGLSRINPPEVIKLDILDAKEIERVLDEVKYEFRSTNA